MIEYGFRRKSSVKTFGFFKSKAEPVDNTIIVDFINQSYVKSGQNIAFSDVFDFKRASKAWLITDSGLQEFDNDVARITNDGLLIEQQATNYITHSNYPALYGVKGGDWAEINTSLLLGKAVLLKSTSTTYVYADTSNLRLQSDAYISYYVTIDKTEFYISSDPSSDFMIVGVSNYRDINTQKLGTMFKITGVALSKPTQQGFRHRGITKYGYQSATPDVTLHGVQLEDGNHATSFIITKDTPVTRQADILQLKNTATAVTGDWDDTLELSIVDGQLVHSGYGYIRRLELKG